MRTLTCLLMANWGLGLELARHLHARADVAIGGIVTDFDRADADPWRNAVLEFAEQQGYAVRHESTATMEELAAWLRDMQADLLVVHACKRILPPEVFGAPRMASVNIHPSLLPRHRGRAPHLAALASGETQTGLTCHIIDKGIDTGPIVSQAAMPLAHNESVNALLERQKELIHPLMEEALARLRDPSFTPRPQETAGIEHGPQQGQRNHHA